jgi:cytidyltransferase-like protein
MKSKDAEKSAVGLCFGAFDPLHYGHIRLMRWASDQCHALYACTESDEVIRAEKGREPFCTEQERLDDLASLIHIHGVHLRTPDRTREDIARHVGATVLIVGSDWEGRWAAGEPLGLPILYFPYIEGISSTVLRNAHAAV